ncbi:hypothetical protein G4V62_14780 [Bacillaceae bacterium SIJ1]|uniref:2'-5' RNA ligase family protein n=1 Tax=Litoribacterium kuwaitense TaxID=1398745 RepID=UPI0013EC235D|nr:2'-5' RNA ligase family protein [Litoribacterium kuwaitense]NGP46152.1 hypothetical protein [Litoribacterium kuwaitense]
MQYGVVLFPSKRIQDEANSYRKRYDPRYSLIPPHITIKPAFELEQVDDFKKMLKQTVASLPPVDIQVKKVGTFNPVNNVIYFKVEKNDTLLQLYEALKPHPYPSDDAYAFVPHITIGQELSNDELFDVYESLRMTSFDFTEKIYRVHLCYQLENGSWSVDETYPLQGDVRDEDSMGRK